jgi:hypothetical protein
METSPLLVKGSKIKAYDPHSGTFSRDGSYRVTPTVTWNFGFFWSRPKDNPNQSPLTTHKGMWGIYSNLDPHVAFHINIGNWHKKELDRHFNTDINEGNYKDR